MNRFAQDIVYNEGLVECCDLYGKFIYNFDTLTNSFVNFNGQICCRWCLDNEVIQASIDS